MNRTEFLSSFGLQDGEVVSRLTEEVVSQLTAADLAALKKFVESRRYEDITEQFVSEVLLVLTRPFRGV